MNTQCSLNAAIPHMILLAYMKVGALHFNVSSQSGQASCTSLRRCLRIGFANPADFAMKESIRGSVFFMTMPPSGEIVSMGHGPVDFTARSSREGERRS